MFFVVLYLYKQSDLRTLDMPEKILFKKLLDTVLPEIIKKGSLTIKLKNINAKNAYLSASNVEKVKTIWQVDKYVNLYDFYHPTNILVDHKKILVQGANTFPENGKIVIEGTAGQGKSILMRFLTSIELKKGERLPIFVELRKITAQKTLYDLILDNLKELGLNIDSSELTALLASGKCSLFLDAFDEIHEAEVSNVMTILDSLCNQHYNLLILISSRPNADIQKSSYIKVYRIAELERSDFKPLLKKLFVDTSQNISEILKAIDKSDTKVCDVITTPLLLTLLVIVYKAENDIPNNLVEFYEKLFLILCLRHDSTKPGFKRKFRTEFSESKLSKFFDAFCFCCMKSKVTSISFKQVGSLILEAGKLVNLDLNSVDNFLIDITKVTCLLIEEGFEYHFIHKSIKEYHAANFINEHAPEVLKIAFYTHASIFSYLYPQELSFLSTIDEFAYKKYFLIPHISAFLSKLQFNYETSQSNLSAETIVENITITVSKGQASGFVSAGNWITTNSIFDLERIIVNFLGNLLKEVKLDLTNKKYKHGCSMINSLIILDKVDYFTLEFNNKLKEIQLLKSDAESYVSNTENMITSIKF